MDSQSLHPISLAAVMLLGLAMLIVPRRYVLAPMLIGACFIPSGQRIFIATLDFDLLRLLVLFGWTRVLIAGETRGFRWKSLDTLVILWTLSGTVILTLREGTFSALIFRLGFMYDMIGMYFLFRIMIRDWRDVEAIIIVAAVVSIPVAGVFLIEQATGRNMFAIFGGVSEITLVRDGRLRCRGPFGHSIYAGCFWAALMPLIGALWFNGRPTRWLAPVGLVASAVVVMTTASATPIGAMMLALVASAIFPLRRYTAWIRWAAVTGLVGLHLVMVQPVWHLFARVQLVSGTGWYRYKLIDEFINHVGEWWLLGTSSYESWYRYGFRAITNQYVLEGVQGGLLTLGLFVAMIVIAFRGVGRILRSAGPHRFHRIVAWALGVSLLVHCAAFMGVAYFGQVIVVWYLGLSIVGSLLPVAGARVRGLRRVPDASGAGLEPRTVAPRGRPAPVGIPVMARR